MTGMDSGTLSLIILFAASIASAVVFLFRTFRIKDDDEHEDDSSAEIKSLRAEVARLTEEVRGEKNAREDDNRRNRYVQEDMARQIAQLQSDLVAEIRKQNRG